MSLVSQNATLPVAFSASDGADCSLSVAQPSHSYSERQLQPRVSQFVSASMLAALKVAP